jgi:hypothetical protein
MVKTFKDRVVKKNGHGEPARQGEGMIEDCVYVAILTDGK